MKTEQIRKRAASLFSNAIDQTIYRQGAMWRINSVWHGADEKPENDRMVLGIDNGSHPAICGPDNSGWEDTVRIFCITAWAYVDDLLPDTFDKILKDNKDVLERIKEKGD